MTADLSGIRSLLSGITPGPWFQGRDSVRHENAKEVYSEREPSPTSEDICTAWHPHDAAFIAAAPSTVARLLGIVERVEAVRQELFDISNDENWTAEHRAAYRDASRAINTAITGEGGA